MSTQYRLRPLARLLVLAVIASAAVAAPGDTPESCHAVSGSAQPWAGTSGMVVTPACFQRVARFGIAGVPPGTILVRDSRPFPGEPCGNLYAHAADVVTDANGAAFAVFTFAGGAATGRLPISADAAKTAASRQPYMTDVQLGSYEPGGESNTLVCVLSSTYHFYCPATGTVGSLCLTWVDRRRSVAGGEGAAGSGCAVTGLQRT